MQWTMLSRMTLFARVVDAKSFSAAAETLHMSKSTVSKQINALEKSLGVRLLNRTTRQLSLTEAGGRFYQHCTRIVSEEEAAVAEATRLSREPRGNLKVASPAAFGRLHVAPALADYLNRYPKINVEMVFIDRPVNLAEEGFDVAIKQAHESELNPNLVARRIAPVRWVICAAPEYLRRCGSPGSPEDLSRHCCLFYSYLEGEADWQLSGPEGEVSVHVSGRYQANNSEGVREVALRGVGLALLPTFIVGNDLRDGLLRRVLDDYEPRGAFGSSIYAVYLPTRYLPQSTRTFIDFMIERFGGVPSWDRTA